MRFIGALLLALTTSAVVAGCRDDSDGPSGPGVEGADAAVPSLDGAADSGSSYDWQLPPGLPTPNVPPDNPMTKEKVVLGRRLFYDKRLSKNQTQSCASCHKQELAFTDGRAQGLGSTGQLHPRSSMTLVNVAYATTLSWANPLMTTLERQAQIPIFGEDPVELGTTSTPDLEARLAAEPIYVDLFAKAFPDAPQPILLANALKALASFQRSLIAADSPFDRASRGDPNAMTAAAKRGNALFHSEKFECFHCHVEPFFSDHVSYTSKPFSDRPYHNTGLYNIDGQGGYPAPNTGVFGVTRIATDMGRFKAPSLRNIAVTAPYMHDGSIPTLEGVLDHYVAGGRNITSGPNAGNGGSNPLKDPLIVPLNVTAQERADVIAFLESLTDQTLLTDPKFSDPWTAPFSP